MNTIKKALLHGLAIAAIALVPIGASVEGAFWESDKSEEVVPLNPPKPERIKPYKESFNDQSLQKNYRDLKGEYRDWKDKDVKKDRDWQDIQRKRDREMNKDRDVREEEVTPEIYTSGIGFYGCSGYGCGYGYGYGYGAPYGYRPYYYRPYYHNYYYYPYYRPYYYYTW